MALLCVVICVLVLLAVLIVVCGVVCVVYCGCCLRCGFGYLISRFVVCVCCLFRFGLLFPVTCLLLCLFARGLGEVSFRFRVG